MTSRDGLLLFAHGARDPSWARPFESIAANLRAAQPDRPLALAFLELLTPNLMTAGAQLVAQGCQYITVVPLFLGAGGHVKRDLPQLLETLQTQHPATRFRIAPPIGETDSVIASIAQAAGRAGEADWARDPNSAPQ